MLKLVVGQVFRNLRLLDGLIDLKMIGIYKEKRGSKRKRAFTEKQVEKLKEVIDQGDDLTIDQI